MRQRACGLLLQRLALAAAAPAPAPSAPVALQWQLASTAAQVADASAAASIASGCSSLPPRDHGADQRGHAGACSRVPSLALLPSLTLLALREPAAACKNSTSHTWPVGCQTRALHRSAAASATDGQTAAPQPPSSKGTTSQRPASRAGRGPTTPRPTYDAPVWLPRGAARRGVPRVLLSDPWISQDKWERRTLLLTALLDFVRAQPARRRATAQDVYERFNAAAARAAPSSSGGDLQPAAAAPPLLRLPSLDFTLRALEFLRHKRLLLGRTNPASDVARGHPDYPYLYVARPFQVAVKGPPHLVAKAEAERQARRLVRARRRLRSGKPPFAIHRTTAKSSVLQHALAYEAVDLALQQQQHHQQLAVAAVAVP